MNAEIIKAMNRKTEKHPVRDWWKKNDYKVLRVVLFPVWICMRACKKIKDKLDAQVVWSDERANEILSYYVPRKCSWDEENQELYFFDNGYGWNFRLAKKYLKRKDYAFWKKFGSSWCLEIREFLVKDFELEGFTKEVVEDYYGTDTEIIFKMK